MNPGMVSAEFPEGNRGTKSNPFLSKRSAVAYLLLFAAQGLIRDDHDSLNSFAGSDFWMNELNAGAVTSSARRW
jgi:hypothetical protein